MNQSLFRNSIQQIADKNKFFQCFTCLQQYNNTNKFPMQICQSQHFMCLQCVEKNLFRKNKEENGYACSLCFSVVQKNSVRRSPFILSLKVFVDELIERQIYRKNSYKECLDQQVKIIQELRQQNEAKSERIQIILELLIEQKQINQEQLKEHQQILKCILQQIYDGQNSQQDQPQQNQANNANQDQIKSKADQKQQDCQEDLQKLKYQENKNIIQQKIGELQMELKQKLIQIKTSQQDLPEKIQECQLSQKLKCKIMKQQFIETIQIPEDFKQMFMEIELQRLGLQHDEDMEGEQKQKKLKQLQQQQQFLFEIISNMGKQEQCPKSQ